jgi:hypothetical protein
MIQQCLPLIKKKALMVFQLFSLKQRSGNWKMVEAFSKLRKHRHSHNVYSLLGFSLKEAAAQKTQSR